MKCNPPLPHRINKSFRRQQEKRFKEKQDMYALNNALSFHLCAVRLMGRNWWLLLLVIWVVVSCMLIVGSRKTGFLSKSEEQKEMRHMSNKREAIDRDFSMATIKVHGFPASPSWVSMSMPAHAERRASAVCSCV